MCVYSCTDQELLWWCRPWHCLHHACKCSCRCRTSSVCTRYQPPERCGPSTAAAVSKQSIALPYIHDGGYRRTLTCAAVPARLQTQLQSQEAAACGPAASARWTVAKQPRLWVSLEPSWKVSHLCLAGLLACWLHYLWASTMLCAEVILRWLRWCQIMTAHCSD